MIPRSLSSSSFNKINWKSKAITVAWLVSMYAPINWQHNISYVGIDSVSIDNAILLEDGSFLLLEDGSYILLETA